MPFRGGEFCANNIFAKFAKKKIEYRMATLSFYKAKVLAQNQFCKNRRFDVRIFAKTQNVIGF